MLKRDVSELQQEKQFIFLVTPSQCILLDSFKSVRCEKEYVLAGTVMLVF